MRHRCRPSTTDAPKCRHRDSTAVEWGVIEQISCSVKLLKAPKSDASFHDFDEFERLVEAASEALAFLIVLPEAARLGCDAARSWRSSPSFELTLANQRWTSIRVVFDENNYNGPSARREPRRPAFVVVSESRGDVVRLTDVEGTVRATQDVHEPHPTTTPSSRVWFKGD